MDPIAGEIEAAVLRAEQNMVLKEAAIADYLNRTEIVGMGPTRKSM